MLDPKLELSLVRAAALPAAVAAGLAGLPAANGASAAKTVRHQARIWVKATPEQVHSLLDPNSSRNRWVIRRESVTPLGTSGRSFRIETPALPDQAFHLEILSVERPFRISYRCGSADGALLGAASASVSVYNVVGDGEGCETTLEETTDFQGVDGFPLSCHSLLMRLSLRMDLLRLKYEADTGLDADARD